MAEQKPEESQQTSRVSQFDGAAPESTDFANYFCTYGYLYHQKDMIQDHRRTGAYHRAIVGNPKQFEDKVVLDVGAGSGILAIFAAKAGAKKVYAVEATDMAKYAKTIVEANQVGDKVEVIQGMIESVELPEQVDIIISEWMGYFLLRESMLDSVLTARDKFLKPGGALYPSHATMYLAPIGLTPLSQQRQRDFLNAMDSWNYFNDELRQHYMVDMSCVHGAYKKEQKEFYLQQAMWNEIKPDQLLGPKQGFLNFDLLKVTKEELMQPMVSEVALPIMDGRHCIAGLAGFFDVEFRGSPQSPADVVECLSTEPDDALQTHWGQQVFMINPDVNCQSGDSLRCKLELRRRQDNHRLLLFQVKYKLEGESMFAKNSQETTAMFRID